MEMCVKRYHNSVLVSRVCKMKKKKENRKEIVEKVNNKQKWIETDEEIKIKIKWEKK